jgi:hypothetical protein
VNSSEVRPCYEELLAAKQDLTFSVSLGGDGGAVGEYGGPLDPAPIKAKVGPARYRSPRHPPHFKPSVIELNGIL